LFFIGSVMARLWDRWFNRQQPLPIGNGNGNGRSPAIAASHAILEEAELRAALRVLEESWGDDIDPSERYNDVAGFSTSPKVVFTAEELRDIRGAARILVQSDKTAAGILEKLTNYVIRTGFTYTAIAEQDVNAPVGLVEAVQRVVDECRDLNNFDNQLDREIFADAHEDGECPVALYVDEWGQTKIRPIDPDQIVAPKGQPPLSHDWSYGVDTPSRDVRTVYGYWVQWPDELAYVEAESIGHIKLNDRRQIKRGVSDFYPTFDCLRDSAKLLRNMSRGAQVQAAIAFIREHAPNVTQSGIQSMVGNNATSERTATYQNKTVTEYTHTFKPGRILDVRNGTKYQAGPMGQNNAPIYIQVLQAGWRAAAQRWSMPEYLVSSDASNANFSSTLVAGDPFVLYCEQQQAFFSERFLRIFWKAIQAAAMAGRFAQFGVTYGDILRVVDLKCEPPDVAIRDREKETNRRSMLYGQRVISLKQWRQEEGYDPEEMAQQVSEEPPPIAAALGGMPGPAMAESYQERLKQARELLWGGYP